MGRGGGGGGGKEREGAEKQKHNPILRGFLTSSILPGLKIRSCMHAMRH